MMIAKPFRRRIGLPYVRAADRCRERAEWIEAVLGYRRGLEWMPWRDDLKVQIGNCLKEFGDYQGAVKAYSSVVDGVSRPEALKQMADANQRASVATLPFKIAERAELVGHATATNVGLAPLTAHMLPNRISIDTLEPRRWLGALGQLDRRSIRAKSNNYASIMLDQVGVLSLERDGAIEPLFAGIVAIRARIVSPTPIGTVTVTIGEGDEAITIANIACHPVERGIGHMKLHVVNAWIDSAQLPLGRRWLTLDAGNRVPRSGLFVNVVAHTAFDEELAACDAYIASPADGSDPESAVVACPPQARPAARSLFDRPVHSILAMRADQLGDVSASLPALARLRGLYPDARLTVLVQPGVRGIVEASGIADQVLTIELPYNPASERRHLPIAEEQRLRELLRAEQLDLAIDLNPGDETRPLLLLSGAYYLAGFNADRFTFLDFGIGVTARDKVNQHSNLSHAATVMMLIEALTVAIGPSQPSTPRSISSDEVLAAHRLRPDSYVVLHTGARHELNCWPLGKFLDLAERLLSETNLDLVIFVDAAKRAMRPTLFGNPRARFLDVVGPDAFDAIVSSARLLVGNDSGPKHLAATRGVPTVSVHVDRLNWNEWGQDGRGTIISRRVPCTGCGLNDVQLCGRDAICVRSIDVDDVSAVVRGYL